MSMTAAPGGPVRPPARPIPVDQAVEQFGHAIRRFVNRAQRGSLTASLSDIPRRTEIASLAYSTCVPALLQRVLALRTSAALKMNFDGYGSSLRPH